MEHVLHRGLQDLDRRLTLLLNIGRLSKIAEERGGTEIEVEIKTVEERQAYLRCVQNNWVDPKDGASGAEGVRRCELTARGKLVYVALEDEYSKFLEITFRGHGY